MRPSIVVVEDKDTGYEAVVVFCPACNQAVTSLEGKALQAARESYNGVGVWEEGSDACEYWASGHLDAHLEHECPERDPAKW